MCLYFALTYQVYYGLSGKPSVVSLSAHEQQKQETADNLVIGGGSDLIDKYETVGVPESHETPMLNSTPATSRVSISTNLLLVALQPIFSYFYLIWSTDVHGFMQAASQNSVSPNSTSMPKPRRNKR